MEHDSMKTMVQESTRCFDFVVSYHEYYQHGDQVNF